MKNNISEQQVKRIMKVIALTKGTLIAIKQDKDRPEDITKEMVLFALNIIDRVIDMALKVDGVEDLVRAELAKEAKNVSKKVSD